MITTLNELLNSEEYQSVRESNCSDWINDPDRANRCAEAAYFGCDGSTHYEVIQDMREALDLVDVPESVADDISAEIDDCEAWHDKNGSLDDEIW